MIAVDTNVLLRYVVLDDPHQGERAARILEGPDVIAISLPTLCELLWVLRRHYRYRRSDLLAVLDALLSTGVKVDHEAVSAGRALLARGGDFADGVIAHQARAAGATVLYTFDRTFARRADPDVCRVALADQDG